MADIVRPRRSVLYMPGATARALEKAKTLATLTVAPACCDRSHHLEHPITDGVHEVIQVHTGTDVARQQSEQAADGLLGCEGEAEVCALSAIATSVRDENT